MKKKIVSKKFSFKGWKINDFFRGFLSILSKNDNMKKLKELIKWATPGVLGWLTVTHPLLIVPVTIAGKGLLDILQFFVKEKTKK